MNQVFAEDLIQAIKNYSIANCRVLIICKMRRDFAKNSFARNNYRKWRISTKLHFIMHFASMRLNDFYSITKFRLFVWYHIKKQKNWTFKQITYPANLSYFREESITFYECFGSHDYIFQRIEFNQAMKCYASISYKLDLDCQIHTAHMKFYRYILWKKALWSFQE